MDEENENLSLYLHRVEASARKILRKNNELRSRQGRKQIHSTSSAPWKNGRLNVETKVNLKANELVTFNKASFRSEKELIKSKNDKKHGGNESMKVQSWKDQKSENDIDMDISSGFLRKRYRSDENMVMDEQRVQLNELTPEHPLKALLTKHVEAMHARVNKMTEKRLRSFPEEVYKECVKALEEIKTDLAKEKEDSCDNQTEIDRIMPDICGDNNQEVLQEVENDSLALEPSSRRIPCLPPQRWTLATLEPMTPWNELYYVSIYRYCPNSQTQRIPAQESMPLFVIDFHGKDKDHLSRHILKEQDITGLCNPAKDISLGENCRDLGVVYTTPFDFKGMDDYVTSTAGMFAVQVIRNTNNYICTLSAKITITLRQNETCVKNASIEVPMNVIIATLGLFDLAVSSDEIFWTKSDNNETVWAQFLKFVHIQMEKDEIELKLRVPEKKSVIETIDWSGSCRDIGNTDFVEALITSRNIISHLTAPPVSSSIFLEHLHQKAKVDQSTKSNLIEEMESQRQLLPSLAVRLSGPLAISQDLIPGVCSTPFPLNWEVFGNSSNLVDETEVAFTFNRETPSSPLSVTTRVAFQCPIEAPRFKVFDKKQMIPEYSSYKPVQGPIPLMMSKAKSILKEELDSLVDARCPGPVTLIDVAALDDKQRTLLNEFPKELNDETSEFYSEYGFRTKVPTEEFLEEKPFPLHNFGITEEGLSPNAPITSERTFMHSTEVCDYLLSEERGSKDFMHMVQNPCTDKNGGYPNDPMISIVHMNGYKVGRVEGIKMKEYRKREEKMIQEQEEKKKKEILSLKMKAADRLLKERLPHVYDGDDDRLSSDKSQSIQPSLPSTIEDEALNADVPVNKTSFTWRNLDETLPEGIELLKIGSYKLPAYEKSSAMNTLNTPTVCDIVKPTEGIDYVIDDEIFKITPTMMFVKDLLEDRFQMSQKKHQEQRSRDIILNAEQEIALDHIIRVPLEANHSAVDTSSMFFETKSDIEREKRGSTKTVDNEFMSDEMKAILATRHADFETLEYLLDEIGVEIDTHDEYGNSLLILAAQQGNKKLCKFLLRRGAYINAQNHQGNTVLHYLYEYGHVNLAEYLIQKGADDSFLNIEGLTCFEGTSRMKLDDL